MSYYLRASRMYDTLLQMGRWFGYRPGYVDLCRLYTTDELREFYSHITMATDELRTGVRSDGRQGHETQRVRPAGEKLIRRG